MIIGGEEIRVGDVIQNKNDSGQPHIVIGVFGNRATAVRLADVTNPDEWEVLVRVTSTATGTAHSVSQGMWGALTEHALASQREAKFCVKFDERFVAFLRGGLDTKNAARFAALEAFRFIRSVAS